MTAVCPATPGMQTRGAEADECSCLPTRAVEQDLATGISPLGSSHPECVKVPSDMIIKEPRLGISVLLCIHYAAIHFRYVRNGRQVGY